MTFQPEKPKLKPCLPVKVVPSDKFRIGRLIDARKRFCWVPIKPNKDERDNNIIPYWPGIYYESSQEITLDIDENDAVLFKAALFRDQLKYKEKLKGNEEVNRLVVLLIGEKTPRSIIYFEKTPQCPTQEIMRRAKIYSFYEYFDPILCHVKSIKDSLDETMYKSFENAVHSVVNSLIDEESKRYPSKKEDIPMIVEEEKPKATGVPRVIHTLNSQNVSPPEGLEDDDNSNVEKDGFTKNQSKGYNVQKPVTSPSDDGSTLKRRSSPRITSVELTQTNLKSTSKSNKKEAESLHMVSSAVSKTPTSSPDVDDPSRGFSKQTTRHSLRLEKTPEKKKPSHISKKRKHATTERRPTESRQSPRLQKTPETSHTLGSVSSSIGEDSGTPGSKSTASSSTNDSEVKSNYPFGRVWKVMQGYGWHWAKAYGDLYYAPPSHDENTPMSGKLHVDYFDIESLKAIAEKSFNWVDSSKSTGNTSRRFKAFEIDDLPFVDGTHDYSSRKKQKVEGRPPLPSNRQVKKPDKKQKDKKPQKTSVVKNKEQIKKSRPKKSEKSRVWGKDLKNEETHKVPSSPEASSPNTSSTHSSQESLFVPTGIDSWWFSSKIPSDLHVWTILNRNEHFNYSGGRYRIKDIRDKGETRSFENMEEFRKHLCGLEELPLLCKNEDGEDNLTNEEKTQITRWLSTSFLPIAPDGRGINISNSMSILGKIQVLSNDDACDLLHDKMGFKVRDIFGDEIESEKVKKLFDDVDELRKHIRCTGFSADKGKGRRNKTEVADGSAELSVEERIGLILWSSLTPWNLTDIELISQGDGASKVDVKESNGAEDTYKARDGVTEEPDSDLVTSPPQAVSKLPQCTNLPKELAAEMDAEQEKDSDKRARNSLDRVSDQYHSCIESEDCPPNTDENEDIDEEQNNVSVEQNEDSVKGRNNSVGSVREIDIPNCSANLQGASQNNTDYAGNRERDHEVRQSEEQDSVIKDSVIIDETTTAIPPSPEEERSALVPFQTVGSGDHDMEDMIGVPSGLVLTQDCLSDHSTNC